MSTLSELRERAKEATEEEIDAEMELLSKHEPDEELEIEVALKEADLIEAAMDDLDEFYSISGYKRLNCVCHKVFYLITPSLPLPTTINPKNTITIAVINPIPNEKNSPTWSFFALKLININDPKVESICH